MSKGKEDIDGFHGYIPGGRNPCNRDVTVQARGGLHHVWHACYDGRMTPIDGHQAATEQPDEQGFPWDQWFAEWTQHGGGEPICFQRGVHYPDGSRQFAQTLRKAAWARGYRAMIVRDRLNVTATLVPRDDEGWLRQHAIQEHIEQMTAARGVQTPVQIITTKEDPSS